MFAVKNLLWSNFGSALTRLVTAKKKILFDIAFGIECVNGSWEWIFYWYWSFLSLAWWFSLAHITGNARWDCGALRLTSSWAFAAPHRQLIKNHIFRFSWIFIKLQLESVLNYVMFRWLIDFRWKNYRISFIAFFLMQVDVMTKLKKLISYLFLAPLIVARKWNLGQSLISRLRINSLSLRNSDKGWNRWKSHLIFYRSSAGLVNLKALTPLRLILMRLTIVEFEDTKSRLLARFESSDFTWTVSYLQLFFIKALIS